MKYARQQQSGGIGSGAAVVIILAVGGLAFWQLKTLFRERHSDDTADAVQTAVVADAADTAPYTSTPLLSSYDGGETGRVERTIAEDRATYRALTFLPALGENEVYRAWLLKKGLADVVPLGVLSARADGSFGLEYVASPATGVAEPRDFTQLVITREARQTDGKPTGNVIVRATFEE